MLADDRDPALLLTDTLFHKGWASALPPSVIDIFEVLGDGAPPVLDEIDARLRGYTRRSEGLDSPAWSTADIWFQRDGPVAADGTAARFSDHLASKGLPTLFTTASVLRLLVACEVVTIGKWGEYSINPLAPAAEDVLSTPSSAVGDDSST